MSVAGRMTRIAALLLAATLAPAPSVGQAETAPDISRYDRGTHIVRPGENLHFITRKYLGDKLLWRENWKLNPTIVDPDRLTPGQRIQVLIEQRQSVPTARLSSIAGRVEGRPAPIPWSAARELDLMLEEDGLRTATRASTEMEFHDGTRVLMTEDSVVYLRRSGRRLVGIPPRAVEIVEGQAEVEARRPAGSDRSIEILVGGTRAVSRPDETGAVQTRARRTESAGAKVMVYEGGGEVESGGQKVSVGRGMGTSVEAGEPPAPPEKLLPPPSGLAPEPGTRLTFNNVELAWQPVAGAASYTAELCGDADCALLVERRVGLTEPGWQPEAPSPGDYFWRVTAVSTSGLDGYPSPGAALAVLGGPDQTGPTGNLVISGRQLRFGSELHVDENVRIEPMLEDSQSGVAGWQPLIDGVEVSRERWGGPWPDGRYQLAVRATDRAGNESLVAAAEEVVVDALPPVISVTGIGLTAAGQPRQDRSRCGWLDGEDWRWRNRFQCRWERKAAERWLGRGWNWLEVSVDGRHWHPLIDPESEAAREVTEAGYGLPDDPAAVTAAGDSPQLFVRSADGSPLRPPGSAEAADGLLIWVEDAGVGVGEIELRSSGGETGGWTLSVEAVDAMGHGETLSWPALARQ